MRLQKAHEFARIRDQGQRHACGCLVANWVCLPEGSPLRLGVVASRKLGGSVVRSRARRLLREVFRLHQHDFKTPVAMVLVARHSIVGKAYAEVERDFLGVLRRNRLSKAGKQSEVQ
jgi:ribonuclease P protein component